MKNRLSISRHTSRTRSWKDQSAQPISSLKMGIFSWKPTGRQYWRPKGKRSQPGSTIDTDTSKRWPNTTGINHSSTYKVNSLIQIGDQHTTSKKSVKVSLCGWRSRDSRQDLRSHSCPSTGKRFMSLEIRANQPWFTYQGQFMTDNHFCMEISKYEFEFLYDFILFIFRTNCL